MEHATEHEFATIVASLDPRPPLDLPGGAPVAVQDALLARGYRTLLLTGALLDELTPGAGLVVEDDARLLLDWYAYAERLVAAGGPFGFDTVLADGAVTVVAASDADRVRLRFELVPELDPALAVTSTAEVSVPEYAWWWRSIAGGLCDLAGLP